MHAARADSAKLTSPIIGPFPRRHTEVMSEPRAKRKILVVDDDAAVRRVVRTALEMRDTFACLESADALDAHRVIIEQRPDLVLLDWMLSGVGGLALLRRLRREQDTRDIPVIMLTARTEVQDRVIGLDGGADDYIVKPFLPRELIARIWAVLRRRSGHWDDAPLSVPGLNLDSVRHRVLVHGRPTELRPMEFRLLHFLMSHAGQTFTREQLLSQVWGEEQTDLRTADVHVSRLRKALASRRTGGGPDCGAYVRTVRGIGYCFDTTSP